MVGLFFVFIVFDFYLEIMLLFLVVIINGGNRWLQLVFEKVIIDVFFFYDFDYGRDDKQGFKYIWYCKIVNELDYEFFFVLDEYLKRINDFIGVGCF